MIFFLPGLGDTLFVSAYISKDGALTAGVLVCASIIATAASLLVDAVCAVVRPALPQLLASLSAVSQVGAPRLPVKPGAAEARGRPSSPSMPPRAVPLPVLAAVSATGRRFKRQGSYRRAPRPG